MSGDSIIMRVNIGGQCFDITQDFIDKYPESTFAKSLEVGKGKGVETIEIDRCGKYFPKILEYGSNKNAIKFSYMSHIEIKKLLNDAKFYGLEDLIERCEGQLETGGQPSYYNVDSERKLNWIVADETRLLIIVDSRHCNGERVKKAAQLVDRNRCLIVCRYGRIEGQGKTLKESRYENSEHHMLELHHSYDYVLYDPKIRRVLLQSCDACELLSWMYYAETLNFRILTQPILKPHKYSYSDEIYEDRIRVKSIES